MCSLMEYRLVYDTVTNRKIKYLIKYNKATIEWRRQGDNINWKEAEYSFSLNPIKMIK